MKIFLYSNAADQAVAILQAVLLKGDLSDSSPLSSVLKDYFSSATVRAESKSNLLNKLKTIPSAGRPAWTLLVDYCEGQVNGSAGKEPAPKEDTGSPEKKALVGAAA